MSPLVALSLVALFVGLGWALGPVALIVAGALGLCVGLAADGDEGDA